MTAPSSTDMDVTVARRFVLDFLQKTRFADRFPPRTAPPAVESRAREIARSWKLDISEKTWEYYFVVGLDIGYAAFQHTPHALQITMTLFTFCATMFDDAVGSDMQAMREFIPRICSGEPQSDPILVHFLEMAGELRGYLPDYTANMVHTGMMAFANEELCGWKDANQLALKPEAGNYIEYSRYKNGISEPYAACIWPTSLCPDVAEYIQAFPDTLMFINYVKYVFKKWLSHLFNTDIVNICSDFMSFYKEVLEEDEGSYVSRYGQLNGKTFVESVDDLVEKIISTTERIRKILGEGQARECWEDFASGFVHFGLFCPRYRWKEVVPEYF